MLADLLPLLRGAVILLFLPLVVTLPVAYFRALRPRRGTTEWMRRLDAPQFRPIRGHALHMADLAWAPLGMLCAMALCLLLLYFQTGSFLTEAPWRFYQTAALDYLPRALLSGGLAAALYLLLRGWYPHSQVAFCCAALCPLLFGERMAEAASLSLALWCFWQWMTADPEAGWFRRALFLLPAALCYGLSLLLCWPGILLLPLFVAGYIRTLVWRWRRGSHRVGRLLLTMGLSLLLFLCTVLGLWILYGFASGTVRDWSELRNLQYYGQLLPTLLTQLQGIFQRPALGETLSYGDLFPLLLGLGALLPLCHGLFRRRDERCLHVLLLLLGLLAVWLLSGAYLLPLGLLLAYGWAWESCAARRCSGAVWGVALGLGLFLLTDTVFILLGRYT